MTPQFTPNFDLLLKARAKLAAFEHISWIIGGSGSGKSTICRAISTGHDLPIYDMDEHIFGLYMKRYTRDRHPASMSWFSAENSLEWAISLPLDEFDSMNRTANAEYLDLFAEDMAGRSTERPLLVDGGITHPSILTQAIPRERVLCIGTGPQESALTWNTDPDRLPMKQMVLDLNSETATWKKFLAQDRQITETIQRESQEAGITIVPRPPGSSVESLSNMVLQHLGI